MLPFENDFIRFFSTREKIRSLKAKEEMQKNYCRKSIDKKNKCINRSTSIRNRRAMEKNIFCLSNGSSMASIIYKQDWQIQ